MSQEIELLKKEIRLKQLELVELRKQEPLEEIRNYNFVNKNKEKVDLLSLFQGGEELLVIHNMGKSCKYCTMWADGFRGYTEIIADRMPWVLTSPDPIDILQEFAKPRNWNFNYLSHYGSSFAFDLGFGENKEGRDWFYPGVSALILQEGKIYRTAKDDFGPGDLYNPAWHFYDLFPNGAGGWQPKFDY